MSYSRFQSNARQDEGMIFLLTMERLGIFFCFVLYSLSEKKKRRILTVFIKIIKLSTGFPNIPFVESGRYDLIFVFNIARMQIMGGNCAALCAALCAC